ncbi:eukaryotic translation elongation factor 2a tandem duplicate 1-related [Anaeramoeba flamelloides]|uniref:Eukaryotic translation elongation factor 2a tandem duplicate 1-related n=1 Tax=Anaeramoeba flamelloides TaxID=1746091 RepID=A0AAV7Z7W3_9EUKA|nr:eukaryotic translation elongation factor 2a tandem duplicate 1-related [Anaeramoeba flamelloides]
MSKYSLERILELMNHPSNIRNISVVAHVDHGKTTLTDSLVSKAGIISSKLAGEKRVMDTRKDEQLRCITIKSTAISLFYELDEQALPQDSEGNSFLINLIDSPGHVDFSSEVTAALRVSDGALVVVDCVSGAFVQTETVLNQALSERVKPVLMINKVDRAILELQLEPEEIYQQFVKVIESINVIISSYEDEYLGDCTINAIKGNVGFGAGKQGWSFTLNQFAEMYAKKWKMPKEKILRRLWGDNFWDPKRKKWVKTKKDKEGNILERGFCKYVMGPICQLFKLVNQKEKNEKALNRLLNSIGVKLTNEEKDEKPKELLVTIMKKFLPAADALIEMIIYHLPSPKVAQKYRVQNLYEGDQNDECAQAIANCDPEGPLMMYVSKMIPTKKKGRFYAFGRVFSGTIKSGQKITILGQNYRPEFPKKDRFLTKIQNTVLMMGNKIEPISKCCCGNMIGLVGVDDYLVKTGTLTTHEKAFPFKQMSFTVSPVVRIAIKPKKIQNLPKLIEGMQKLEKADSCVKCLIDEKSGEYIIAGAGELHLEICLKDLKDDYCKGIEIISSEPVVSFSETVTQESSQGIQYLNEIKSACSAGFQSFTSIGVLCSEPVRGVKIEIKDVKLHADSIHRGENQIIPMAIRSFYASELAAKPRLMEPIFLCEISVPKYISGQVYNLLNKKRGIVLSETPKEGSNLVIIKSDLPIIESFGFNADLRSATQGKAFEQCVFDHWEIVEEDPLKDGTRANQWMKETRIRKGLEPDPFPLEHYHDKL